MSSALDRLAQRAKASPASVSIGGREIDVPLAKIRFDPSQPRKAFHHLDGQIAEKDDAYIQELAATIKERGLIQAITVQEMEDGSYLVVVGECRTRAHLLLGLPTIRAVVRNDLTNLGQRLLYQIAENVNRQDLTDDELAGSVRVLMKGGNGLEPMSQVQIAKALGKPEGWITRLVRFGDEELQRLWIKTGIVDTVENLYRVSILPKAMQVDILRRVELPEGDYERLAKPLERKFIDGLTREAKIGKSTAKLSPGAAVTPAPVATSVPAAVDAEFAVDVANEGGDGWIHSVNGVRAGAEQGAGDVVAQALAAEVVSGYAASPTTVPVSVDPTTEQYTLPPDARAAILGSVASVSTEKRSSSETSEPVQAPVNCRASLADVQALLAVLQANAEVRSAVDGVQCDLMFPGALAQLIANELAGVIVDRKEVPAVMQRELAKLR